MRHFAWLLTLPVTVVTVVFAVSNLEAVTLDFWPFAVLLEVPLFLLVLGCLLAGFMAGAAAMWLSGGKRRRQARSDRYEVAELKREVQRLQQRHIERPEGADPAAPTPVRSTDIQRLPAA